MARRGEAAPDESEKTAAGKDHGFTRRTLLKSGAATIAASLLGSRLYDYASRFARDMVKPEYAGYLARVIEKMKSLFPEIDQWNDAEEWAAAIVLAFEKNQLEMTDENLGIVLTLLTAESGFRPTPRALDFMLTPSELDIGRTKIVKPRTGGPMEMSVKYVMQEEGVGYEEALRRISTVEGGVHYGVKHIKKLLSTYSDSADETNRLLCVFADYNAGPFASRNAGIQHAINSRTADKLREDGLIFSKTREALKKLFEENDIPIDADEIGADLKHLLRRDLQTTQTWRKLEELTGTIAPVPADRPVLGIAGFAKKALTGIGDSREFAYARLEEYQKIRNLLQQQKTGP